MSGSWRGFDQRVFLTEAEWSTYNRRPPVRYAAKVLATRERVCEVCGRGDDPKKLQASHKVPFLKGVRQFGLTPEWLDGSENLVWACKVGCNKGAELTDVGIHQLLGQRNFTLPDYILTKAGKV